MVLIGKIANDLFIQVFQQKVKKTVPDVPFITQLAFFFLFFFSFVLIFSSLGLTDSREREWNFNSHLRNR